MKTIDTKTNTNTITKQTEIEKLLTPTLDKDNDLPKQSQDHQDRVQTVLTRYEEMKDARDQGFRFFGLMQTPNGGRTQYLNLRQYIEESEKRLNGNIEKPSYKDDWQSNIFDNVTRDKTISVIARLAAQRMQAKFFNDKDLDPTLSIIVSNLYDKAGRGKLGQGRDDEFTVRSMWEAITKGTVVREEQYRLGKRRIKVTSPDITADTDSKNKQKPPKYKTIYEWEDVWSTIVPLEEFYPGDISRTNIQEMPDVAIVTDMDYQTFRQQYYDYPESIYVEPTSTRKNDDNSTQFRPRADQQSGKEVRVIKYYNRITDSFDIIANDRLLTPLHNPLPYQHKQLPFNVGRFEMLSNNFFYGMSMAFKLAAMQDMTNSIWNLSLDQLILALKTPIFNFSGGDIDIDWLYPNAVIDMPRNAQPNSIIEHKKDLSAFSASQSALSIIKGRMDENSGAGSEQAGVAGAGRGRTAEEVSTAREAALDIIGLFLKFMEWAEEDRAEQRVQIMLEKYAQPRKCDGKLRSTIIDGVPLLNGEYGKMFINFTKKPREKTLLDKENLNTNEMSQTIDVNPKALKEFKYLIKIIPDSSVKDTEYRRKQESLKWFGIASQAPQIFNINEAAKDAAEAHGKDPNKALVQQKKNPNEKSPEEEVAELLKGKGEQGGMAQGGGVRVPTDKEVANSQPDSYVQTQ